MVSALRKEAHKLKEEIVEKDNLIDNKDFQITGMKAIQEETITIHAENILKLRTEKAELGVIVRYLESRGAK